jgi:hypothetical protein
MGDAKGGEVWLTTAWFEGRMLKDSEVGGRAGGGICWEVRLEAVLDVRRGDDAGGGRGDAGTELRSGILNVGMRVRESVEMVKMQSRQTCLLVFCQVEHSRWHWRSWGRLRCLHELLISRGAAGSAERQLLARLNIT